MNRFGTRQIRHMPFEEKRRRFLEDPDLVVTQDEALIRAWAGRAVRRADGTWAVPRGLPRNYRRPEFAGCGEPFIED